MTQQFTGLISTSYNQMYIVSEAYLADTVFEDAFKNEMNGMLGGARPGGLFLRPGVTDGDLYISVEIHGARPPVDESWEEIVEASFSLNSLPISLQGWAESIIVPLPLVGGEHRARFCANGFGQSEKIRKFGDPAVERYALMIWPEKRRPDEVLNQTSDLAKLRHRLARKSGPV